MTEEFIYTWGVHPEDSIQAKDGAVPLFTKGEVKFYKEEDIDFGIRGRRL